MPNELETLIHQARIPGVSKSTLSSSGDIAAEKAGITSNDTREPVLDSTIFQAASLSKPVFAYIVLKMIEEGKFSREGETPESGLDRPIHEICDFGPPELRGSPNYKLLTPRNILSHQTGLPNWFIPGEPELYDAATNTCFNYSGLGFYMLNEAVQHKAGKPLSDIAREMFDKKPLEMSHSGFIPPPEDSEALKKRAISHSTDGIADTRRPPPGPISANPAASLVTTAEDYAKFLRACLNDKFIREHMFEPQVNLAGKDKKAMDSGVSAETLGKISWGIGMGLLTADNGDRIAFHWGDNETARAFAATNLRTGEAVAIFANSANGPSIFRQVAEPVVGNIQAICQWLGPREKLDFDPMAAYKKTLSDLRSDGLRAAAAKAPADEERTQNPDSKI